MKNKLLGIVLIFALSLSGAAPVLAADEAPRAVAPNMVFSGEAVSLSLDDAIKRITTAGPGYESAVLAKQTLSAQAKGQEELWSSWKSTSNAMSGGRLPEAIAATTVNPLRTLNAQLVKLTRPYLEDQAVIGYEIDINNLVYNTTRVYHSELQAAEALRIARDNLQVQQNILANTNKKHELGMASKMDVLSAESAVQEAAVKVSAADSTLKTAKMSFNMQLDYPLMQDVTLTDSLKKTSAPAIELKDSIESALAIRNELTQLQYLLNKAVLTLEDKVLVSRYSADYLTAELEIKQHEKAIKDAKNAIELEIRSKYMSIQNLATEISVAEKIVENAKEGYRLAELSYNAGMNTLVDVQNAQLASYQAQLALAAKILEYNLAVNDFTMATGYGKGGQ
jgi:outer membrane protein TolC